MSSTERGIILEVSDNGDWIALFDGSRWNVNPGNVSAVLLWMPMTEVEIRYDDRNPFYPYIIKNLGNDIEIRVSNVTE